MGVEDGLASFQSILIKQPEVIPPTSILLIGFTVFATLFCFLYLLAAIGRYRKSTPIIRHNPFGWSSVPGSEREIESNKITD
jgi:hypothetical protein